MKFSLKRNNWVLLIPIILSSCTAYKKVPYLTDAEILSSEELSKAAKSYEATIMPKDVLSITVNTLTNAASRDFNLPLVPQEASDVLQTRVSSSSGGYGSLQNYIVDNEGYINFPVVGKTKMGGLKKSEAEKQLHSLIYPQYLKENPIINIRFLNYKVSVLGEVAKPGIYTSPNEQMTLFDALAYAGDLTIYGNRKNVLLIRELDNGERNLYRIDLQNKDILLNNEIYYLQQNDKIYVQPNKARGNSSSIGSAESLTLTGISVLISIASILINTLK